MPPIGLTSTAGIQQYLRDHSYTCDSVERLAEGFSGFVYRAGLRESSMTSWSLSNYGKFTIIC